jgi:riboflavin synthase
MFTGLIEATGRITGSDAAGEARRLRVATPLGAALRDGDSIAVSGVCLTVMSADAGGFTAIVSPETLRVTTLAALPLDRAVNLERPLRADGRLGGHFVLGHVDGLGRIAELRPDGDCSWLAVDVPAAVSALVVPKGSIAIDGISLTVAHLGADRVGVQIVPYTLAHTSLADARPGDAVNLEADVIGKYVAKLLGARSGADAAAAAGRWS